MAFQQSNALMQQFFVQFVSKVVLLNETVTLKTIVLMHHSTTHTHTAPRCGTPNTAVHVLSVNISQFSDHLCPEMQGSHRVTCSMSHMERKETVKSGLHDKTNIRCRRCADK
jgi:hypothetical protein